MLLLQGAPGARYKAALVIAYGAGLTALALLDPQQHAFGVDVADLKCDDFGDAHDCDSDPGRGGHQARGREREALVGERTHIINRLKSTLAWLGIRGFKPYLRNAAAQLATLRTLEGRRCPTTTRWPSCLTR